MDLTQAIILGIVQGLTEFLPVSSSGHLVLARDLLGLEVAESPAFEVVVHLGTLASILLIMRAQVFALFSGVPVLFRKSEWRKSFQNHDGFRYLVLLIPATIPTVLVGLLLKDQIDSAFGNPRLAATMLLVTAGIVGSTFFFKRDEEDAKMTFLAAFAMGVAQAFAITPGISRSGSTIATGLWCRRARSVCGDFSFLMALPAIIGAAVLHAKDIASIEESQTALVAGFMSASVTGALALVALLKLVRGGRLWVFAPYLIVAGGGWLVFSITS